MALSHAMRKAIGRLVVGLGAGSGLPLLRPFTTRDLIHVFMIWGAFAVLAWLFAFFVTRKDRQRGQTEYRCVLVSFFFLFFFLLVFFFPWLVDRIRTLR